MQKRILNGTSVYIFSFILYISVMASKSQQRSLMVAAIDFGSSFSGYAYSFTNEFEKDPLHVCMHCWAGGTLLSLKTPTCVLFDQKKTFHSFGFDAEYKYADLKEEEEHKDWHFFRKFKMKLNETKRFNRDWMLTDEGGKDMPAIDVFAAGIKYLKDRLLQEISNKTENFPTEDIKWVLTVPAIWDVSAKKYMLKAAEMSGIPRQSLVLVSEPEVASMYCRYLPVEKLLGSSGQVACFKTGSRYMVLDAGGEEIGVTVYEIMTSNEHKEIYKDKGGPWGGTMVDNAYLELIRDIVGVKIMEIFKDRYEGDKIDLMRDFECKKRRAIRDQKVFLRIPNSLLDTCKDIKHKEMRDIVRLDPKMGEKISLRSNKLLIAPEVFLSFFKQTTDNIVNHLQGVLKKPEVKGTNTILMIGGFSESTVLIHAVKTAFPNMSVIIPDDPGMAVLKGAVIYGHHSEISPVSEYIFRYTYGVETIDAINADRHDRTRWNFDNGRKEAVGIFSKIVEVGQSVTMNVGSEFHFYHAPKSANGFNLKIYASPRENPQYVDDEGCKKVCDVHVWCREDCGCPDGVLVSLVSRGAELEVLARHCSKGELIRKKFDMFD